MSVQNIEVGICRFTVTYGLGNDGQPYLTEQWENLSEPGEIIPMITRTGLLTMAQQTLTGEALGLSNDEWDTDDEG
jgi:hypothetical protein